MVGGRESFKKRGEEQDRKARKNQSPAHRRSLKQEKKLAVEGGGTLTPGSGNKKEKGDVMHYFGVFRIEAKCTSNKSFSVTREMIEKIEDATSRTGEIPAIMIEFIDEDENVLHEVAVVPAYALREIADRVRDGDERDS